MNNKYIIGVDGGASKTDFIICDDKGIVRNRLLAASCNPNDIGMERCLKVLQSGISRLTVGLEDAAISAYAGISGGSTGWNKEIIHQYLKQYFPRYRIENGSDAVNAMQTGLGEEDGIVAIAGTGSVVYVRAEGSVHRIGGWGYLFDNACSGYNLGRDAIYAALCEYDGTGEKTVITGLLEDMLDTSVESALAEIYKKGKSHIASFAAVVFEACRLRDNVAKEIINRNVTHLAKLIETGGAYLTKDKITVACVGGLFKQRDMLLSVIKEALGERYQLLVPEMPPVFGAVKEACRLAGAKVTAEFEANFKNTLEESRGL